MIFEILGVVENEVKCLSSLDWNLFLEIFYKVFKSGYWIIYLFIYCEFIIDCCSLQRKDNVAYESKIHSIYMFFFCCNEERM